MTMRDFLFRWRGGPRRATSTSRAHSTSRRARTARLRLEVLEDRLAPAVANWNNPAGGDWHTPENWDTGTVPAADDDVVIAVSGADVTITHSMGNDSVRSVTSTESLTLSGGSLHVSGNLSVAGAFAVSGGTLGGATVLTDTRILATTGTLDGVTVDGILDLTSPESFHGIVVTNGLTLNGTALLGDAIGFTYGGLSFAGTQTLGGTGQVVFGKHSSNFVRTAEHDVVVTIGPGMTLRGSNGSLSGFSSGFGAGFQYTGTFINQGTIAADDSGGLSSFAYDADFDSGLAGFTTATIDTSAVTNPAPQLVYQTAHYGNHGNFLNGPAPFSYMLGELTPGASYTLRLHFAELENLNAGERQFHVEINGTRVLNNFDIVAAAGGNNKAVVRELTAVADANGRILLTFRPSSGFSFYPRAQVNGIELLSGATLLRAINAGQYPGGTITITPNVFVNQGQVNIANAGTLNLDRDWSNSGTINLAPNGTLNLGGAFTTNDIGTINRTGGSVNLTGTLDNSGDMLVLDTNTGSWNLKGGRVQGGTYAVSGDAKLIFTTLGGTLEGLTANSDLDLATNHGAFAHVVNGLTLNGTAWLGDALGATSGGLYFDGTQTLSGTGEVVFGKHTNNFVRTFEHDVVLTIAPGMTVRGSNGSLSGFASGFGAGFQYSGTIINQGIIAADDSGGLSSFAYDADFDSGLAGFTTATIDTSGVTNPAPQLVYQTAHYGNHGNFLNGPAPFSYMLGELTPGASYTLRLHFAELENLNAGERQFHIEINGTQVLQDFDIVAVAGGKNKAVVRELTVIADASGRILLTFRPKGGSSFYPRAQVNGVELLSGTTVVRTINAGQYPGGTITISPNAFVNQGQITVANAGTLNLDRAWSNSGTINVAPNGTLNLGGAFTTANITTMNRTGGTVNLTGTLDNSGDTLVLDTNTGSWNVNGGKVLGGAYTSSNGAKLIFTTLGGTLEGLTANSDLDLATNNGAFAYVVNGLTLNGTARLGNAVGSTFGGLYFDGTQTLGGTGEVVFGKHSNNLLRTHNHDVTLTIGPDITLRGSSGSMSGFASGFNLGFRYSGKIVNQGTIAADDSGGDTGFDYDSGFGGGTNFFNFATPGQIDTTGVTDAAPAAVYQTLRYGTSFSYTLDQLTPGSEYQVRLHFADGHTAVGQRRFDVNINGTQALSNFDIFALTGVVGKAVIRTFTATADVNGRIVIDFVGRNTPDPFAIVNGIELLSGSTVVRTIDAGSLPGGTITINPPEFQNAGGQVQVSHGETLSISGIIGNVGSMTLADTGSRLLLDGSGYVVDQNLSAGAGQTLALAGSWSNAATISVNNATLSLGDPSASSSRAWSNDGTITATNSTVNLGGMFSFADLGIFVPTSAMVNLIGTLANTNSTLPLDSNTGSWHLAGGKVQGGTYTNSDGVRLIFTSAGGTLEGLTANGALDLENSGAFAHVVSGLTLNGTARLGDALGSTSGGLYFDGTQTLDGAGEVVFGKHPSNILRTHGHDVTLTIGPGITVRGSSGSISGFASGFAFGFRHTGIIVNRGSILADDSGSDAGSMPGGSITINSPTFVNEGQVIVSAAGTLSITEAWSNSGTIDVTAGGTATLGGSRPWSNVGTITTTDATVNLGGVFTLASLGVFNRSGGGAVNLVGTLDNVDATLALDSVTGSWNLVGGTVRGGTYTDNGVAHLIFTSSGGTLDGLTANGVLDLVTNSARVTIANGLTLNGTALVGSAVGSTVSQMQFAGTQTLGGTGTVVFGSNSNNTLRTQEPDVTLTIGPGVTVRGDNGNLSGFVHGFGFHFSGTIVNRGTIAPEVHLVIDPVAFINQGVIKVPTGALLDLRGNLQVDTAGALITEPGSIVNINGSLLGDNQAPRHFEPEGTIQLTGAGTSTSPQLVEAMGRDLGNVAAGFRDNFNFGTLNVAGSTYALLVDFSDNASGTDAEAIYVDSLIVHAGATLDLNGLKLYARTAQIDGTVTGGTIAQVADSGPLAYATLTPGSIAVAGERDEWTIFARKNRTLGILVDPGSATGPVAPQVGFVEVTLLDPANRVLAIASNVSLGAVVTLENVTIPADGTYRIQVRAAAGHTGNTGNYLIAAYDVTPDIANLNLNQVVTGTIENAFSVDRWTFTVTTGQSIQFDFVNATTSGLVFDLTDPFGVAIFTGMHSDSELLTLPVSGTYTLSAHGTGGRTGAYAFQILTVGQTDLTLGTTYHGTLTGSGQAQLFRVQVPTAGVLKIHLDDSAMGNRNEVYAKFGSPPTRGDYDYRAAALGNPDQELLVPRATAGTWYILVYSESVPVPGAFTLLATTSEVTLTSASIERIGNSGESTLTLNGAGFDSSTTVELIDRNGTVYPIDDIQEASFDRLSLHMTILLPAGPYDVRLKQTILFPRVVSVSAVVTGAPNFEPHLVLPGAVRRNSVSTIYVEYTNTGNVAMQSPVMILQSGDPDDSDKPWFTLDQSRITQGFWTSGVPDGLSHTIQILANGRTPGVLQPGESMRVPVYYVGLQQPWDLTDGAVELELRTLTVDNTEAIKWDTLKTELRPSGIRADAWDALYTTLVAQVGPTFGDYVRMLGDNAGYLGRLGQSVYDVGQLWAFELEQANGFSPLGPLASAIDAAVATPGLSLTFGRVFADPISERYTIGPLGRGWSTPWQTVLVRESDGSVNILGAAGAKRRFQPDSRSGAYFAQPGDYGTLLRGAGGTFILREADGTTTAFRADGKLDFVADTNGNRITAGYAGDRLISLTHSSGQSLTIAYNAAGLIQSVTSSDGRSAQYTYDANQHLIAVLGYDNQTMRYTYSATIPHALTAIEFPGGTHELFTYDGAGRLASISRDGNAERVGFSYDTGRVTVTDAFGGGSKLFFDHRGLLVKIEDTLGNITQSTFDANFNLTRVTDATGGSQVYSYDERGNVIAATDALGNTVTFGYGALNRLTSVSTGRGATTRYAYDARGNLLSTTYPNNTVERAAYDALGNALSFTNRRGQVIGYEYNSTGQVTRQNFADGSHIDFAYDAHNNLITATDAAGTTTFEYAADRLTKVTYPSGRFIDYTYDAAGRRTRMVTHDNPTHAGFVVNYAYDAAGRLASLTDETGALIVRYTYDAAGRLSRKDMGNGTFTTYAYDVAGQLLHLVNHAPDGAVNSRFDYTYDRLGRRTAMDTLDGRWTYTYDATGQLTHAVFASTNAAIPSQDLTYVYDALGNRIRTIENGIVTNYTTNNLNQYTQVGGTVFTYDTDGNLTAKTGDENATYSYDAQNRLVSVVTPAGTWTYEYDAFGNRVATVQDGERTEYLLDLNGLVSVVSEFDETTQLTTHYTHGFGLVNQSDEVSLVGFYDFDAAGSTGGITNSEGIALVKHSYAPYGETDTSSVQSAFGFVGQFGVMTEDNGLHFMRARFYDSRLGRFTAEDPLGLNAGSVNFLQYASNQPTNKVDFGGLDDDFLSAGFGSDLANDYFERELGRLANAFDDALRSLPRIRVADPLQTFGKPSLTFGILLGASVGVGPSIGLGLGPNFTGPSTKSAGVGVTAGLTYGTMQGLFLGVELVFPEKGTPADSGTIGIVRPVDPNEKTGPAGFGSVAFIRPDVVFPYRIDFENDADASAPAQVVHIIDTLDPALDASTFELTEIAFGDFTIAVPGQSQFFQTTLDMTFNGETFQVQIEAGLHTDTRQVYARFQSIDPNTSLPPDVLTGFLPPENGTGRGQGHISYTIRPQKNLPTGTQIRNIALITFDGTETIATNQVDPHDPSKGTDPAREALNTIDAGAPTTSVALLPASLFAPNIPVTWSGNDDTGGSGLAAFDVFVSINGGIPTPWLRGTTATSAIYQGIAGNFYAFYSVGIDNVGNRESPPSEADTFVLLVPATGTITGRVFIDYHPDSIRNGNEPGAAGRTVYIDANGNGKFDPDELSTTTTDAGNYNLIVVPLGRQVVRVVVNSREAATAPAGITANVRSDTEAVIDLGFRPKATFLLTPIQPIFVPGEANSNAAFVRAIYRAILGREAESQGLAGWVGQLQAGTSRRTVVAAIWNSDEHRSQEVASFYRNYLHREGGSDEIAGWVNALRSGVSETDIVAGFLGSAEYKTKHPDDRAFVEAVYEEVLGRGASSAEVDGWVDALAHGVSRTAVADGFLDSTEAQTAAIDSIYASYLERDSDAGSDGWLRQASSGEMSLGDIAQAILASDEFQSRALGAA